MSSATPWAAILRQRGNHVTTADATRSKTRTSIERRAEAKHRPKVGIIKATVTPSTWQVEEEEEALLLSSFRFPDDRSVGRIVHQSPVKLDRRTGRHERRRGWGTGIGGGVPWAGARRCRDAGGDG